MLVLIVSPHSLCDNKYDQRHCDKVAKFYSEQINNCILADGHNTILYLSNALRFNNSTSPPVITDYNRKETNESEWRKQLATIIRDENPDLILEIHSYPGPNIIIEKDGKRVEYNGLDKEFSDLVLAYYRQWRKNKVVIIQTKSSDIQLVGSMFSELSKNVDCRDIGISTIDVDCAISEQFAGSHNHIFLEFNEQVKDKSLAFNVSKSAIRSLNSINQNSTCNIL